MQLTLNDFQYVCSGVILEGKPGFLAGSKRLMEADILEFI